MIALFILLKVENMPNQIESAWHTRSVVTLGCQCYDANLSCAIGGYMS